MKAGGRRNRPEQPDHAPNKAETLDPAMWIKWSESAMTESMKWFDVWLQGSQRLWSAGFRMLGQPAPAPNDGLRRASDLSWMPHVEAQVIPLRRKTDRPGSEATRYSMRMPIPWPIGGAKVISLEAIVGQPAEHRSGADDVPDDGRSDEKPVTE
ncbi:hypothetical protein [Aromatoleum sp.]|uniref:hypothetical protein n=1 Tax=Aromatoleum sp. TaxID=2307007 RepID=UPI002FC893A6